MKNSSTTKRALTIRLRLIAMMILAMTGIILILQNTEHVNVKVFFVTLSLPHSILLLITAAGGFAVGVLVSFLLMRKTGREQ